MAVSYTHLTVDQFLKIILETKPEDCGCIVIFDPKDRPLGSYHYKNGEIIHDFTNEKVDDKIIRFAFGNGSGASMDYTLTWSLIHILISKIFVSIGQI